FNILSRFDDHGVKLAKSGQEQLTKIIEISTGALRETQNASRGYGQSLDLLNKKVESFSKLSWLGVAGGFAVGKAFTSIATWAEKATVKVAAFGEELYYMNRRLAQPGTAGLFNVAFASQMIGLSPEQGLGAVESLGAAVRTNPGIAALLSRFTGTKNATNQTDAGDLLKLVNSLKGKFGEQGYFVASQFASEFGVGEHEFRQMWTNIEELNEQYKVHGDRLKELGLNTDKSSKSFVEFNRALTNVTDILEIKLTQITAWLAQYIGTPVLNTAAKTLMLPTNPVAKSSIGGATSLISSLISPLLPTANLLSNNSLPAPSAPTPTMGTANNLKESAISYYQNLGISRNAAIGIVTGMQGESGAGLDPNSTNPTSGMYGVMNWDKNRRNNFERIFGHDIHGSSREEQMQFAAMEMQGTGGD